MINEFSNPDALANSLSEFVATALTQRIKNDGVATLAVSGGTTPIRFFEALANTTLDWSKVTITLVDDRWVPDSSPRSNAMLVKKHLHKGHAAAATFHPLVNDAPTPETGRDSTNLMIGSLALPFAAVVLGMGTDGHTASFFPAGDRLASALKPAPGRYVETMRAEAAGEPRITLTLPVLLEADHVMIHIEGQAKRAALEAAWRSGPVEDMPIRAILLRDPPPDIFWSP